MKGAFKNVKLPLILILLLKSDFEVTNNNLKGKNAQEMT